MTGVVRRAIFLCVLGLGLAFSASGAVAAPYAAMVIDARSGKVLHARNADTRLHPASLTKMMTLYVVFDAVRRGEIGLDTRVRISQNAAAEPPSKLYLKAGTRVRLRYLIRASAVKSANDAATALAEAVAGSEAAFTDRMNRTARALGMSKTNFRNAHGLTQDGHLSTARDMTTLGRALFYHYPEYYNLFSRRATDAGGKTVYNTNRKFLNAYRGADGIKTGYTRAAGFNLVASAERGSERIIATMFGGSSTAARNARVAELLDLGFQRAPSRVAERAPRRPRLSFTRVDSGGAPPRLVVSASPRPQPRPIGQVTTAAVVGVTEDVTQATPTGPTARELGVPAPAKREVEMALAASTAAIDLAPARPSALAGDAAPLVPGPQVEAAPDGSLAPGTPLATAAPDAPNAEPGAAPEAQALAAAIPAPRPRPSMVRFSSKDQPAPPAPTEAAEPVVVTRARSQSGAWSLHIGTFASRYEAERTLLKAALLEIETLDEAGRMVLQRPAGFDARFTGLDQRTAALACERLSARAQTCETRAP